MEVFELKSGKVIFVSSLFDLQDEIIETLGEDVFRYIKGLCTFKSVGDIEIDQVKALQQELDCYDGDITNLRSGLVDTKESIDKLITTITTAKRINKDSLINTLENMSKDIANNESY